MARITDARSTFWMVVAATSPVFSIPSAEFSARVLMLLIICSELVVILLAVDITSPIAPPAVSPMSLNCPSILVSVLYSFCHFSKDSLCFSSLTGSNFSIADSCARRTFILFRRSSPSSESEEGSLLNSSSSVFNAAFISRFSFSISPFILLIRLLTKSPPSTSRAAIAASFSALNASAVPASFAKLIFLS